MDASFIYESEGWGYCKIDGDNDTVRYILSGCRDSDTPVNESRPSREEWDKFWSLVESLDAWSWQGSYGFHVVCGSPWSLTLEYGRRKVCCEGNGVDEDSAPPGFERLETAMRALAGVQ